MVASNFNQNPSVIIMDLVAAANSGFDAVRTNFTFKEVTSGTFITAPAEGSAKNTGAVITPTTEGAATYEGDVTVNWDRLSIAAYLDGVTTDKTFTYAADGTGAKPYLTASSSTDDILLVLRNLLGIFLPDNTEFDKSLYALTEVTAGTKYTVTLSPLGGTSFLFSGQTETITINQPAQKQQTSSVVQETELDGLDAPSNGG